MLLAVLLLSGCQAYTHWTATELAGCDPVQLDKGICAPRAKGATP